MSEIKKIRDVCSRFSSGKSISASQVYESGWYPVYGGNGLRGYTDTYNFEGDCAVIGRQGAYCGNVKYFSGTGYMTEHAIVAVANNENNTRFLSYKFALMNLGRYAGQSAQPGLSVETLLDVDMDVPDKNEQEKIVKVLSALDGKIDNNNEMVQLLEQVAKLLYDYWFVQFDFPDENGNPYKSSGGKMVWNEELKREIPEGWEIKHLSDLGYYSDEKISASELSSENYIGMDNLLPDMKGRVASDYTPNDGFAVYFEPADTLLGNIRPYFKKIWFSDIVGGCSPDVLVIKSIEKKDAVFIYSSLTRDDFFAYDMAGSKGSKMPRGDKEHIMRYPLAYDECIRQKYVQIVSPWLKKMADYYYENWQLASLRDFLLPMLMNGQVKVKG